METTILYIYIYIGVILGLFWDNGKENGNYYIVYIYMYILRLPLKKSLQGKRSPAESSVSVCWCQQPERI